MDQLNLKTKIEKLLNSEDKNRRFGQHVGARIEEIDFDFQRNIIRKLVASFDRADMRIVIIENFSLIGKPKDVNDLVRKIAKVIAKKSDRLDLLFHCL